MPDDFSQQETAGGVPDPSACAPRRIGDFQIVREIGRGGMGIVFEARQVSLNRSVALKLLPPGLGFSEKSIARFRREAQAAARLHHTNIVPVYATGEETGSYYYAMELVEGQSLAEVLRDLRGRGANPLLERTVDRSEARSAAPTVDGPAPGAIASTLPGTSAAENRRWFDTVARLMAEVAEGLHHAHGQGVIHRDIKPANLMLSNDGRLCITDFGLALMTQEPGMTMSGLLVGSPAYMSPEQIAAGRVTVDHRTDVYSLGVVLYETLTWRLPFPGETREAMLTAILTREPARPRGINPRVPLDLETICLKAMDKNPDRRYATAGEMAADLRRYLQGGLILARRAGPLRRAARTVRRHRVAFLLGLSLLILAAAGIGARVAFVGAAAERMAKALAEARLAMESGDLREALARADAALALEPDQPEARLLRARALVGLDRAPDAVGEAREILARDPGNLAAQLILVGASGSIPGMSGEDEKRLEKRLASQPGEPGDLDYFRSLLADNPREELEHLDAALERNPAHLGALARRAARLRDLKRFPEALSDCDRLLTAQPRSAMGRRLKAQVFLELGDDTRALQELDRAIEQDRGDVASYLLRGRQFCQGDRKSEEAAFRDLDEAIRLDPGSGRAYDMRAWCHFMFGRNDRAIEDARRAIALGPDRDYLSTSYARLCSALHRLGQDEEARGAAGQFRAVIAAWPDRRRRGGASLQLVTILRTLGDLEAARGEATRSIEDAPSWSAFTARADLDRLLKDDAGWRRDCRAAKELPLDQPGPLSTRASTLRDTCGDFEAALADHDRAIALAPGWGLAYTERAWTEIQGRLYDRGFADYARAIDLAPNMLRTYNARGKVHLGLRHWEEALRDFDRSIALEPNRLAFAYRALALDGLGRIREEKASMERAIPFDPNAINVASLGSIAAELGETAEADDCFRRAIATDPRSAYVRVFLAWHEAEQGHCEAATRELQAARDIGLSSQTDKLNFAFVLAGPLHQRCPGQSDPVEALRLAREGTLRSADAWDAPNPPAALALACFRNGLYRETLSLLRSPASAGVGVSDEISNRLLLAMTEWKLGRRREAVAERRAALDELRTFEGRNDRSLILLEEEVSETLGLPGAL